MKGSVSFLLFNFHFAAWLVRKYRKLRKLDFDFRL